MDTTPTRSAVHAATMPTFRLIPADRASYRPAARTGHVPVSSPRHTALPAPVTVGAAITALACSSIAAAALMMGLGR